MKKLLCAILLCLIPLLAHASTYEITTSGNNVGIGSSNPGAALDVNGTVRATAFQGISNGDVILVPTSNNVGIGTTTTTALLTVKGKTTTTTFQMTQGAVNGYALISDASGNGTWGPSGAAPGGAASQLQYYSNSTTLGGIASTGTDGTNVGIGTVTPTSTLTIQKSSTTDMLRVDSSNQAGGNIFLIQNGGNVSIGSTNPGAKLDVNGTVRSTSFVANGSGNDYFPTNVGIGTSAAAYTLTIFGNVGIGTSNATVTQGVTGSGGTSCLCKQFIQGICVSLGTCT